MAKKVAPKAGPLTQAQVVAALAEKVGLPKTQVKGILEELSALAVAQTKKNGKFVVPGLGRMVRTDRKARMGRNPATGAEIKIPAKKVVKFRLAKATADQIVPPKIK
jgi:DNA-binding protein HU-beta